MWHKYSTESIHIPKHQNKNYSHRHFCSCTPHSNDFWNAGIPEICWFFKGNPWIQGIPIFHVKLLKSCCHKRCFSLFFFVIRIFGACVPNRQEELTKPGLLWRWRGVQWKLVTPLKTNMTMENPPFSIGNTSSNGWFSIVMSVFLGESISSMIFLSYLKPHQKSSKNMKIDLVGSKFGDENSRSVRLHAILNIPKVEENFSQKSSGEVMIQETTYQMEVHIICK